MMSLTEWQRQRRRSMAQQHMNMTVLADAFRNPRHGTEQLPATFGTVLKSRWIWYFWMIPQALRHTPVITFMAYSWKGALKGGATEASVITGISVTLTAES